MIILCVLVLCTQVNSMTSIPKVVGSIPTVAKLTFQLARCGCTLRVTSQTCIYLLQSNAHFENKLTWLLLSTLVQCNTCPGLEIWILWDTSYLKSEYLVSHIWIIDIVVNSIKTMKQTSTFNILVSWRRESHWIKLIFRQPDYAHSKSCIPCIQVQVQYPIGHQLW
jgi:hypothetical protein